MITTEIKYCYFHPATGKYLLFSKACFADPSMARLVHFTQKVLHDSKFELGGLFAVTNEWPDFKSKFLSRRPPEDEFTLKRIEVRYTDIT